MKHCIFLVTETSPFKLIHSSKQLDLYDETFRQLVDSVLEGYNGEFVSIYFIFTNGIYFLSYCFKMAIISTFYLE